MNKSILTQDEEIFKAYHKYHQRKGHVVYDQPSGEIYYVGDFGLLTNVRGVMAKYNLKTRRFSFRNLN